MNIETNISVLLAFVEHINDATVKIMRPFVKTFVTLVSASDMKSSMMRSVLFLPPSKMFMSGTPSKNWTPSTFLNNSW